jgi:pSer/pThr/pTyr-binding forkhead associated (FHA) protein
MNLAPDPFPRFTRSGTNLMRDTNYLSQLAKHNPKITWGDTQFRAGDFILIGLPQVSAPLVVRLYHTVRLGRAHDDSAVDLSPYQADELGVSRQHAQLELGAGCVKIVDLNSTNGTFLNGLRLKPGEPRIVRDGDELHLGALKLYLYFTSGSKPTTRRK